MRLQITVIRNHLEPVRNVFNTKSKQYKYGSITYISDLLKAVDSFIQLESDSWGFEDYAVETKLNDSQELAYELFHWQAIEDVLHDDDEVVIRPISELEMRQRVRGGRHQVRRDGVHLIDGGAWGKGNVLPPDRRPRVFIPPRLRTIVAPDKSAEPIGEEISDEGELQLQIEDAPHLEKERVSFVDAEEEDETYEDGDFVDASTASSQDSSEDSLEDGNKLEVSTVSKRGTTFVEKASNSDEDENQGPAQNEQEHNAGATSISEDELEALKADALKAGYRPESKKRKRAETLQMRRTRRKENSFRDFPTQDNSEVVSFLRHSPVTKGAGKLPNVTFDDHTQANGTHIETSSSYETSSSSVSGSSTSRDDEDDSENEGERSDQVKNDPADTSSSGSDSDSAPGHGTSSSESDSSFESSSESGESSSTSDGSQDSEHLGAKEAATSNSERERRPTIAELRARRRNVVEAPEQPTYETQKPTPSLPKLSSQQNVPPGSGQNKTKRNNERKRLNKIMKRLKEQDKLHQDANFEDLRAYLQEHEGDEEVQEAHEDVRNSTNEGVDELDARRQEIFQRLNAPSVPDQVFQQDPEIQPALEDPTFEKDDSEPLMNENTGDASVAEHLINSAEAQSEMAPEAEPTTEKLVEEPSPKRARLDIASSRRMLFNALGVRNPKTPAAEQALREKLSKPARTLNTKAAGDGQDINDALTGSSSDRWKNRLTIKAVECVQKNKKIEIPPFPFKHPWQVRKEKEKAQRDYEYQDSSQLQEQIGYEDDAHEVEMDYGDDPANTAPASSRSITRPENEKSGEMSIPSDFDALFNLQKSDLVNGAIIAYKELHLNDQFQPDESPYRVARILSSDGTKLQLRLADQHRRSNQAKYDEETGQRMYSKFEMPGEDDLPDDGLRQMTFMELICPKFVSPSDSAEIIVAHSQRSDLPEATEKQIIDQTDLAPNEHLDESIVAESVDPDSVAVSSFRRAEIHELIKDAGFDSALDEQLLDPLPEETLQKEQAKVNTSGLREVEDANSKEWRSSPGLATSPAKIFNGQSSLRESSVPSESMVESVRYPHLSQLELDTPLPSAQEQSSSHQDAQRVTPSPVGNTSEVIHSVLKENCGDGTAETGANSSSLPSEVPQTQYRSQDLVSGSQSSLENGGKPPTPPGFGYDGSVSPLNGNNNETGHESVDSDGFPSLRSLASSQAQKGKGRKTDEKMHKLSPEPTRRSRRINKNDSDLSETETPPPLIKASQSQKLRMSQVQDEATIVDLTQSSPTNSPVKSGSSRTANNRRNASSSQQASLFKKSFEGLGEKNLLKRKKRSL